MNIPSGRSLTGEQVAEILADHINCFSENDDLINALANEHPTLLGQIAKAVGIAVMRRAVRDEKWRPFDRTTRAGYDCVPVENVESWWGSEHFLMPIHTQHDGRLDCQTVIGAELMSRQSLI